jgi:acyl dehydratase
VTTLFFEDFTAGRVFDLGERVVTEDEIVGFAREWDPQAIHLDREAADDGPFGGLIASGWHTTCVWMRMWVEGVLNHSAMLSAPGVEEIRWLVPVRPGGGGGGRTPILESWISEGAEGRGTMRLRGELLDDEDRNVMTLLARGHARRREEARR